MHHHIITVNRPTSFSIKLLIIDVHYVSVINVNTIHFEVGPFYLRAVINNYIQ